MKIKNFEKQVFQCSVIKLDYFSHFYTLMLLLTIGSQQRQSHTCLTHETQQSLHPQEAAQVAI